MSEGGNIAITLDANSANAISATAIWSGAGDWSWREELWVFMQEFCGGESAKNVEECQNVSTRQKYDLRLDEVALYPLASRYFLNMTNMYMADALTYSGPDYKNIQGKFLMVGGAKDTLIQSGDDFYKKARQAGVDITYWRIEDMDHSIRKRPELIERSFEWLKQQLGSGNTS